MKSKKSLFFESLTPEQIELMFDAFITNQSFKISIIDHSVTLFLSHKTINKIEHSATKDVYAEYAAFCVKNKLNTLPINTFSKNIKMLYNVRIVNKKINGKKYRIFERAITDEN